MLHGMNAWLTGRHTTRWAQALRVLLLLALLAGQSAAFAHQLDHVLPGHDNACLSCSAGHNLQAAGPVSVPPEAPRDTGVAPALHPAISAEPEFLAAYRGRAPPLSVTS